MALIITGKMDNGNLKMLNRASDTNAVLVSSTFFSSINTKVANEANGTC